MHGFRIAYRSLARRPAFALGAVFVLALSIGATVAIFSILDTVLLKPLPFPDADRLVTVMEANPAGNQKTSLVAPGRLEEWNRQNRTFEALSGAYSENVTDISGREPERLVGRRVAPRYFAVFGMAPLFGRTFTAEEERFGGAPAAVVSEGFWSRRYGRSPDVLSRKLLVGGTGYAIVGVMPAAFDSGATDVWLPAQTPPAMLRVRQARFLSGIGRLKAGVGRSSAFADLAGVQESLGRVYPATDKGWSVEVTDMKEVRVRAYRQALWVVFGAVLLLLAIAVANIAGLMLVQMQRRARDLAIRQAIGGSRAQLVAGVMREVTLIAAAGIVCGSATAWWLGRLLTTLFATVPRMREWTMDWRAFSFAAALAGASSIVFGLWPVLHSTSGDAAPLLAQSSSRVARGRHRLQQTLVVAQVALGMLVAASAGLLVRTYYNLTRVDTGFNAANVVTFHVGAAWNEDRTRVGQLQEQLVAELQRQPDVVDAGITNFLPATGATLRYQVLVEGLATGDDGGKLTVGDRLASSGYLRALGVPLLAGSWCPPLRADSSAPRTAMVNRAFADRYGPDLVGRHFTFDQIAGAHEIVAVVGNVMEDGIGSRPAPYVYTCQPAGEWPDPDYVVRTKGDVRRTMAVVRDVVHRLAPTRPLFGVRMLDDVVAAAVNQPRLNAEVLSLFAFAAIALASIGLYSLLMLVVSERTREIGIRLALGARPVHVAMLVLGGAGRLTVAGVLAGVALAAAVTRLLGAALFGVSPIDLPTLSMTAALFCAVALAASAVPMRRAIAIDSIESIRTE